MTLVISSTRSSYFFYRTSNFSDFWHSQKFAVKWIPWCYLYPCIAKSNWRLLYKPIPDCFAQFLYRCFSRVFGR